MAHVRYQQTMQVGGSRIQLDRNENMAEDWNWRTVKLVGFFIGSFAVLWWIFLAGNWFGGIHTPPAKSSVVMAGSKGGSHTLLPPVLPTVIKVEVVYPPPPIPPTGGAASPKKSGLPPRRAW